jgi:hypothetical protein
MILLKKTMDGSWSSKNVLEKGMILFRPIGKGMALAHTYPFALIDANDALGKSKRDASMSLLSSTSTQKERAAISLAGAAKTE